MQPLISVIIPLYNGKDYIVTCLDSIKKQQYNPLEVIVVNDESKDNSVEVIEEYQRINKDALNIVLIQQKNGGQGAARNTGIANANGKYITFVDQDDTLEEGILSKLARLAEEKQADIVSAGYRRVTEAGKVTQEVKLQQTAWSKFKVIAPWSKLYRTEFIRKNDVRFLPVVLGEDIYFLMQAYTHEPKIAFWNEIGYNWLNNTASVSNTEHKKLNEETSLLQLYDMLELLEKREVLKKDKLYEYFLIKTAVWDILYTSRNNSYAIVCQNSQNVWDWFGKHFSQYKKNPYIRMSKPSGESITVRIMVWGYMLLRRMGIEKLFLRLISNR